jgi:hypothetical protein
MGSLWKRAGKRRGPGGTVDDALRIGARVRLANQAYMKAAGMASGMGCTEHHTDHNDKLHRMATTTTSFTTVVLQPTAVVATPREFPGHARTLAPDTRAQARAQASGADLLRYATNLGRCDASSRHCSLTRIECPGHRKFFRINGRPSR